MFLVWPNNNNNVPASLCFVGIEVLQVMSHAEPPGNMYIGNRGRGTKWLCVCELLELGL